MFGLFNKQKNQNGKYTRQYYSIKSVPAGDRVLDIAQDGQFKGSSILWDGYNAPNQSFSLIQEGPNYLLKCKQGQNAYLTVQSDKNGAKLILTPKSNDQKQRFRIDQKKGSKDHVIYTFCGKCIDCAGAGKKNGTQIVQWQANGGKNQLWDFCDPKDITSSSSEIQ